jgi:hypothetical protein
MQPSRIHTLHIMDSFHCFTTFLVIEASLHYVPYGIQNHMAKALLLFRDKAIFPDGAIVEMTIWQLPKRTLERPHGLKYSLYYGYEGTRIIGYDNEAGKGDHKHYLQAEQSYIFVNVEQLIEDFLSDVKMERGET